MGHASVGSKAYNRELNTAKRIAKKMRGDNNFSGLAQGGWKARVFEAHGIEDMWMHQATHPNGLVSITEDHEGSYSAVVHHSRGELDTVRWQGIGTTPHDAIRAAFREMDNELRPFMYAHWG